jgi:putative oxidoreductase
MRAVEPAGVLIGRCLLAFLFLHEASKTFLGFDDAVRYSEAHGVPGIMLPAAIALELGGGLLIVAGLLTKVAAFLLAGFCVSTALLFHANFDEPGELLHFEKDLAVAGGFLILCFHGAGQWALDRLLDGWPRGWQSGRDG